MTVCCTIKFLKFCVNKGAISKIMNKSDTCESVANRPRAGRPHIMDTVIDRSIKHLFQKNPMYVQKLSVKTIQRKLRDIFH